MRLLVSTSDKIQVITASAVTSILMRADYVDMSGSSVTPGRNNEAAVNSATTTDLVDPPASSTYRTVLGASIRNSHASSSNAITIQHTDGTNVVEEIKYTLLAGESMILTELGEWKIYDANGNLKMVLALPGASQADQEAGTSTVAFVTPGVQHFHQSACKCWVRCGLTANILASYNVTSLTDTGTGAVTITIATDFSSVNYCVVATIEFTSTTVAQSCTTDSFAAGSVLLRSVVEAGSAADPVTWSAAMFGDL